MPLSSGCLSWNSQITFLLCQWLLSKSANRGHWRESAKPKRGEATCSCLFPVSIAVSSKPLPTPFCSYPDIPLETPGPAKQQSLPRGLGQPREVPPSNFRVLIITTSSLHYHGRVVLGVEGAASSSTSIPWCSYLPF